MEKIRTFFVFAFGFISVGLIIILMYIFRGSHRAIRKSWAKAQSAVMGAKFEIFGTPDKEAKLFIINHRSMYDIIALEAILDGNPCWIGKKEITSLPYFGHIMKAPKMITIDREDKKGLITLIKEVGNRLKDNREIMIFPEGTRSVGDNLRKFKPGAKMLAEKYKLKVQPVVLLGSEKILDSKKIITSPGKLEVHFLESLEPRRGEPWFEDLEAKMGEFFTQKMHNLL